jgi:glycosyltransferase involved in cell wall biosynthesis
VLRADQGPVGDRGGRDVRAAAAGEHAVLHPRAPREPAAGSPLASPSTEFRLDEFEHVTFRTVNAALTSPYNTPADYDPPGPPPPPPRARRKPAEHDDVADAPPGRRPLTPEALRLRRAAQQQPRRRPSRRRHAHARLPRRAVRQRRAGRRPGPAGAHYAGDLFAEIQRYAALASEIARGESFDVVHAHDWMTFAAGLAVAGIKGVPLVVHVHSTEFDRSGTHIDSRIYDIERRGMHGAIKVIAVSYLTKNIITQHYGVDPAKVEVVYNAIETNGAYDEERYSIKTDEKIVLFLGRITMQKGPEYFLAAAKKVLEVMDNVKFVMAGSGDMIRRTIEMAAAMGIGHKVLFTGFLRGNDVEKVFKMADLYVMPSVSEPFGIAPLEAMSHDVPVIISKQSGVSEVVQNALKVDFWDDQRDGQQDRRRPPPPPAGQHDAPTRRVRGPAHELDGRRQSLRQRLRPGDRGDERRAVDGPPGTRVRGWSTARRARTGTGALRRPTVRRPPHRRRAGRDQPRRMSRH